MNQRLAILLRISFAILDLVVLNVVFIICQFVFADYIYEDKVQYTYLWFFCNAGWVMASWGISIYNEKNIYSFERFSKHTMKAFVWFLGLVMLYIVFNKDADLSRLFIVSVLISFAISLLVNRFLHLALQHFFQNKDHIVRKIMIIGYNDRAKKLATYLEQE